MKKLLSFLLCLQVILITPAMAQEEGGGDENDVIKSTQNDVLIVAGATIGGAILGLSTLSFVDKPGKHLANIWTGAAIGVIAGVVFVTYNSAQKGQEELENESSSYFNTQERVVWHHNNEKSLTFQQVQFGTQFWQMSF